MACYIADTVRALSGTVEAPGLIYCIQQSLPIGLACKLVPLVAAILLEVIPLSSGRVVRAACVVGKVCGWLACATLRTGWRTMLLVAQGVHPNPGPPKPAPDVGNQPSGATAAAAVAAAATTTSIGALLGVGATDQQRKRPQRRPKRAAVDSDDDWRPDQQAKKEVARNKKARGSNVSSRPSSTAAGATATVADEQQKQQRGGGKSAGKKQGGCVRAR